MNDYFFVLVAELCFLHAECVYAEAWVLCYWWKSRNLRCGVVCTEYRDTWAYGESAIRARVSSETVEINYLVCLGMNKNQNRRKTSIYQCDVLKENESSLCSPPLYMFLSNCWSFIAFYGYENNRDLKKLAFKNQMVPYVCPPWPPRS